MSDETYNGWTNRETWATNLWLSNDEGLYDWARERAQRAADPATACKEFVEELLDPNEALLSEELRHSISSDIGSLWRVDWQEVAESLLEE